MVSIIAAITGFVVVLFLIAAATRIEGLKRLFRRGDSLAHEYGYIEVTNAPSKTRRVIETTAKGKSPSKVNQKRA